MCRHVISLLLLCAAWTNAAAAPSLAVTTSIAASGLLTALEQAYHRDNGKHLSTMIGPSGQVLRAFADGNVGLIITHAPTHEQSLVARGIAAERTPLMWNRFLLLAPNSDPANAMTADTIDAALQRIAAAKAAFLSRGDNSGTAIREAALWQRAGIVPNDSDWYQQSGLAAGQHIRVADVRGMYTIIDEASVTPIRLYTSRLVRFSDDDLLLRNEYALLIAADTQRVDQQTADWMRQRAPCVIATFAITHQHVFTPIVPCDD